LVTMPDHYRERHFDLDHIARRPFASDFVEGAWLQIPLGGAVDANHGFGSEAGDWQRERETEGFGRFDVNGDVFAERVVGFLSDADRSSVDLDIDFGGRVGERRQSLVRRSHPDAGGELGPALMHVGGAAAVVWFEAEE